MIKKKHNSKYKRHSKIYNYVLKKVDRFEIDSDFWSMLELN